MTAEPVDTHDPAGMAAWLRQRKEACLEFYQLTDDAQRLHYLQRWQLNVLPHLAFRFGQAAEMVEQLVAECEHLRGQIPNTPADDVPSPHEHKWTTVEAAFKDGEAVEALDVCDCGVSRRRTADPRT